VGNRKLPPIADDAVLGALTIVVERNIGLQAIAAGWNIKRKALGKRAGRSVDARLSGIRENV